MRNKVTLLALVLAFGVFLAGCQPVSVRSAFDQNNWSYSDVAEFVSDEYSSDAILDIIDERVGVHEAIGEIIDHYGYRVVLDRLVEAIEYEYIIDALLRVYDARDLYGYLNDVS